MDNEFFYVCLKVLLYLNNLFVGFSNSHILKAGITIKLNPRFRVGLKNKPAVGVIEALLRLI